MVAHLLGPGAGSADIEDVTQIVFEAAYKAWPRFRGESKVETWLYGIAARVVMRQLRGWTRHRRLLAAVQSTPIETVSTQTPERHAQTRQEATMVWQCLMHIKPKKRVVYVMHDIEGRSAKEIADILEVPKETVASRLRHARKELVSRLDKQQAREIT